MQEDRQHKSLDLAVFYTVAIFGLTPVKCALPRVVFLGGPHDQLDEVNHSN